MKKKKCLYCTEEFKTKDYRQKFCGRRCSAKRSNENRAKLTDEQKEKISKSLKKYYSIHKPKSTGFSHALLVGNTTKGKYKKAPIKSFYDVSARTRSKIISRLKLKCCICNWNDDSIDIHHICSRKNNGTHDLNNLTPLCPNHHRLADRGKLPKELFITLDKIITQDMLNSVYFG